MNFLREKKEEYFSNWFLKSDVDLFKTKIEEEIRKESKYKINYLDFEELDCVPDWVDGKTSDVVRYAVYVEYEIDEDIRLVPIK